MRLISIPIMFLFVTLEKSQVVYTPKNCEVELYICSDEPFNYSDKEGKYTFQKAFMNDFIENVHKQRLEAINFTLNALYISRDNEDIEDFGLIFIQSCLEKASQKSRIRVGTASNSKKLLLIYTNFDYKYNLNKFKETKILIMRMKNQENFIIQAAGSKINI